MRNQCVCVDVVGMCLLACIASCDMVCVNTVLGVSRVAWVWECDSLGGVSSRLSDFITPLLISLTDKHCSVADGH